MFYKEPEDQQIVGSIAERMARRNNENLSTNPMEYCHETDDYIVCPFYDIETETFTRLDMEALVKIASIKNKGLLVDLNQAVVKSGIVRQCPILKPGLSTEQCPTCKDCPMTCPEINCPRCPEIPACPRCPVCPEYSYAPIYAVGAIIICLLILLVIYLMKRSD